MVDEYLKKSHELAQKHMLERIIFELEYLFISDLASDVDKSILINDLNDTAVFSESEYEKLINDAIKIIKKEKNVQLKLDNDKIVWVSDIE